MKNESLIHEEITREFEKLKEMEVGSDQYKATVEGITKLADRAIEIDRLNLEAEEKSKDREEGKIDRLVRNGLTAAGVVIPAAVTVWGTICAFNFEKEGAITSQTGRQHFGNLFRLFKK